MAALSSRAPNQIASAKLAAPVLVSRLSWVFILI